MIHDVKKTFEKSRSSFVQSGKSPVSWRALGKQTFYFTLIALSFHCSPTSYTPTNPLTVLFPNGGETLYVDSTYTFIAVCDSAVADRKLEFSLSTDQGKSWSQPLLGMAFSVTNNRIEVPFTIPGSLQGKTTKTVLGLLKVSCYEPKSIFDISDECFSIQ
jgi:hypothetical protein